MTYDKKFDKLWSCLRYCSTILIKQALKSGFFCCLYPHWVLYSCFFLSCHPQFHLVSLLSSFLSVLFSCYFFYLLPFSHHTVTFFPVTPFPVTFFSGAKLLLFSCFFISIQAVTLFPVTFFLLFFSYPNCYFFSCYLFLSSPNVGLGKSSQATLFKGRGLPQAEGFLIRSEPVPRLYTASMPHGSKPSAAVMGLWCDFPHKHKDNGLQSSRQG